MLSVTREIPPVKLPDRRVTQEYAVTGKATWTPEPGTREGEPSGLIHRERNLD